MQTTPGYLGTPWEAETFFPLFFVSTGLSIIASASFSPVSFMNSTKIEPLLSARTYASYWKYRYE